MTHEHDQTNSQGMAFFTGLFAGAMIGAGLGLLFAPRAGAELRKQVADSAASAGKAASKTVDELTERGREVYQRAREVASRAGDEVDRVASDAAKIVDKGLTVASDLARRSRRTSQQSADQA